MTAIATLQYGLTVRATGLITAAHAWTSLEPIFQFFDLLSLRKKQDTLILKKKGSIRRTALTRIPEEIWVEIRKLITKERLKSAEEELFHVCMKSCPNDWCSCLSLTKYKWKAIVGRKNIPSCLENFFREFLEGRVKALKPVHHVLSYFGLAHPLTRLIPLNPDNPVDLNSVALIALPSRTDVGAYSTISAEHSRPHNEHSMIDVSLKLPLDADARFVRFIKLFNLQVVSTSISTLRITTQPSIDEPYDGQEEDVGREKRQQTSKLRNKIAPLVGLKGLKNENEEKESKEIKPGWILYTTACDAEH
ncbi:hypothetical protein JCM5350_003039 [Sporobolomyces pararoseus]